MLRRSVFSGAELGVGELVKLVKLQRIAVKPLEEKNSGQDGEAKQK